MVEDGVGLLVGEADVFVVDGFGAHALVGFTSLGGLFYLVLDVATRVTTWEGQKSCRHFVSFEKVVIHRHLTNTFKYKVSTQTCDLL